MGQREGDAGARVRRVPGELLGEPFPAGSWEEPAKRLDELYRWVEQGALEVVEWYLADRARKRRAARLLRAGTAGLLGLGAVLPLLELTGLSGELSVWGLVGLLGAAACACGDRWFGVSAGWMRDVATAQAVRRRLEALQYDWAAESVREVLGPAEGTASEAAERCLLVLRRFSEDVQELVRAETADWMVTFGADAATLRIQSARPPGGRAAGGRLMRGMWGPHGRASMPRQRPPEEPG